MAGCLDGGAIVLTTQPLTQDLPERIKRQPSREPFAKTVSGFFFRALQLRPLFLNLPPTCMKHAALLLTLVFACSLTVSGQEAQRLDADAARAALSVRPPRNPVKSSAPVVKRTYERRAGKGLGVETGAPQNVEVIHRSDGSTEEHPFVSLPILFTVNTDHLLDSTSRANADQMAAILDELARKEGARFVIQGHTSAEGDAQSNQSLSDQRAARVHALLLGKGVSAAALTPQGLGESCALAVEMAPESQRQLDRRVLVVRMK